VSTPSFPPRSRSYGTPQSALDPYRRAVRRHPVLVILVMLVTIAVAVAWTQTRSHEYEATAQILVTPQADDPTTSGLPILTESVDPTGTLQTAATILRSSRAVALAARELGNGVTVASLRDSLLVEPQGNSSIVGVTGTAPTAAGAAEIANAYADAALAARQTTLRAQVDQKLAGIEAREQAIDDPTSAAAAALAGQISTLQAIREGQDPNFSMLQRAEAPASATGTSSVMIIVLAVIVGFVLGVAAALAVEQLSRRVRDEEELTDLAPLPVLARVPVDRRHDERTSASPAGAVEALRALQIQLEVRGRGSRAGVLTSASAGDG
jgi:capsular polysaccharide biosynthesis protein